MATNYAVANPLENEPYGNAAQLVKLCTLGGLGTPEIVVLPVTTTSDVEKPIVVTPAWYTTETVPFINTPICLNLLFPNNPLYYNCGIVWWMINHGSTLKAALE